jgi:hypothetical protein
MCPTCTRKYTGQTGGPFRVRVQDHFRVFKYGNGKSKFSAHLLENKHSIGQMDNIMETLHPTGKGRKMDTLERFYIFRETKINNQINDKLSTKPNIFETVVQEDPHRGLPTAYRHLKNSTCLSLRRPPLVSTREREPCDRNITRRSSNPLQE